MSQVFTTLTDAREYAERKLKRSLTFNEYIVLATEFVRNGNKLSAKKASS